MSENDRGRGMLTEKDIQLLRGESSKSDAAKRNHRRRMRKRIRNALMDFAIVFEHLEPRDRIQILLLAEGNSPFLKPHTGEEIGPPEIEWDLIDPEGSSYPLMVGGMRSMHAFCYLSLFEALEGRDFFEQEEVHPTEIVESLVKEGLQDTYGKIGIPMSVDVNISITKEDFDLPEIKQRFDDGEPVSEEEVQQLIYTRQISFEEMVEYVRDESRHKEMDSDRSEDTDRGYE